MLLVDDNPGVRTTGAMLLRAVGLDVLEAASGAEAVGRYQDGQPQVGLVLLDMEMPGMDGLDTFRALRRIDPGVFVALMSGLGRTTRVEIALSEGAIAFLPKPFSGEDVTNLLESTPRGA